MYVWDSENKAELIGYRMREKTDATKQTHLLTIDKLICEMPLVKSFSQDQDAFSNRDHLKSFGPNEGIFISDFDNFMPRNNPIVNFTPVWPPIEDGEEKK